MSNILGFADSLSLFKHQYPGLTCCKQSALVKKILHKSYEEHNAIAGVDSLTDMLSTVDNIEKSYLCLLLNMFVLKFNAYIMNINICNRMTH